MAKKDLALEWVILGSGTSTGVPVIGCRCKTCRSTHPRNKRLRASAWIRSQASAGPSILIDTSPDFRTQALKFKINAVDAVLYTHPHTDHVTGVDDLRAYTFGNRPPIALYGNAWTKADLNARFPYLFDGRVIEGGEIAKLQFHEIQSSQNDLKIMDHRIRIIRLIHGTQECLGFRLRDIAYVTDCNIIPPESMADLNGLSVLILDCVKQGPHRTHLNLEKALAVISDLRPKKAYLTHLGHELNYTDLSLPKNVFLAYDGLRIRE